MPSKRISVIFVILVLVLSSYFVYQNFKSLLDQAGRSSKLIGRFFEDVNASAQAEPSLEYESLLTRIWEQVNEMTQVVRSNLQNALNNNNNDSDSNNNRTAETSRLLNVMLEDSKQRSMVLLEDLRRLPSEDGYGELRKRERITLTRLIQSWISSLQNPSNCSAARRLVCNVDYACGFGHKIHLASICLLLAYATERTMLLRFSVWQYDEKFEDLFIPLSDRCQDNLALQDLKVFTANENDTTLLVEMKLSDWYKDGDSHRYMPPSIPTDLAELIKRVSPDNPVAFWVGQFMQYLMRPNRVLSTVLDKAADSLPRPIVGVHIRRTDKITEAEYHDVEEYMELVEEYYEGLSVSQGSEVAVNKSIYLATDDPGVREECQKKFPHYNFLGNSSSEVSLSEVALDLLLLARTEYLVWCGRKPEKH